MLGANATQPIGLGDELRGQEGTFHSWGQECYKSSCKKFNLVVDQNEMSCFEEEKYEPEKVRITEIESCTDEHNLSSELSHMHQKKIFPCKVVSKIRLQPSMSESQTLLMRLCPSNNMARSLLNYEPGDHLGVFPCNPPEVVEALLGHVRRAGN